jgi:hypothetical protein
MVNRIEMRVSEEVIKNAVILWAEKQTGHSRDNLDSEVLYNEQQGFHANAFIKRTDRMAHMQNHSDLINAIAFYFLQEHNFRPEDMNIEFFWNEEEGFTAEIMIE